MTNLFSPCNLCRVMVDIVILSESWPVFSGQISWAGGGYWPMTSPSSGIDYYFTKLRHAVFISFNPITNEMCTHC